MSEQEPVIEVRELAERHRYVLSLDGADVGLATYLDHGEDRVFLHTEVRPEFEGRGLAARLVSDALDDVRGQGRRIVALCPYLVDFLSRHHEWDEHLDRPTAEILAATGE